MTITHIARLHDEIVAAGVPITSVDYNGIVAPPELQVAAQPTIDNFDDSVHPTPAEAAKIEKEEATKGVDDAYTQQGNRVERIVMSVATSAIKVINKDRDTFEAIRAATAAATTLADLKTRFAAIAWPPQITNQQLINSIKADIAATPE